MTNDTKTDSDTLAFFKTNGVISGTFTIEADTVVVTLSNPIQVYDGNVKYVTATTEPAGLAIDYTYEGDPVNAGTYAVTATINNPNYIGCVNGSLTIEPASAIITFNNLTQIYDGTVKTATTTIDPTGLNIDISYEGEPVHVGAYPVTATVNDPNYIGSNQALLEVLKAPLTIMADNQFIKEGDTLPDFTFTYDGFVNGETEQDVFINGTSYTLVHATDGSAYISLAGTYTITPTHTADNYDIVAIEGTFRVNPFGPGTKAVKPSLSCVEEINGTAGFAYIAHFIYENANDENVYVPIGESNILIAEGEYYSIDHPELFVSGGGSFDVLFDGNKLTWIVSSLGPGHPTSSASNASSTSSKCPDSYSMKNSPEESFTQSLFIDDQNIVLNGTNNDKISLSDSPTTEFWKQNVDIIAYPNPVRDKLFIQFNEDNVSDKNIIIHNIFGRVCQVKVHRTSNHTLEIDLSGINPGLYFIKISLKDQLKVVRFVKQ